MHFLPTEDPDSPRPGPSSARERLKPLSLLGPFHYNVGA